MSSVTPGAQNPATASIYDETHELFRESFAAFVAKELAPHNDRWEREGNMDRSVFSDAGKHGFTGMAIPEEFGGGGTDDFRYNAIICEELANAGLGGGALGLTLHNDVTTPYFVEYCSEEQSKRWLPGIASGELITAIAMTEPGTGSDLAGIRSTAIRDGDEFVLNGAKTFITNGSKADLVIVVCRTNPDAGRKGFSLLVVEAGMAGFERGQDIEKIGQHSGDTSELFFDDVRVPVANVLGEEGRGLEYLSHNLAQERLSIAISGCAAGEAGLAWTIDYVKEREAFGQKIASFQNTKFEIASMATELKVTRTFIDNCVLKHVGGELTPGDAAMAKLWATEVQGRVLDRCLQLFGGYGYTTEYPIGRAYADARVTRIYGGTSEIMKTIIAKDVMA